MEFLKACPQDQLPVLCRVIHTTADFSYKESLYFSEDAVSKGREALASGIPIITDTTMAASGINKTAAAAHGVQVRCFIGDEDVKEAARESRDHPVGGQCGQGRQAVSGLHLRRRQRPHGPDAAV